MSAFESLQLAEKSAPQRTLLPEDALLLTKERLCGSCSQFESDQFDVSGLTAQQAAWMLNATAGRERAAWREIAKLLSEREAAQESSRGLCSPQKASELRPAARSC